MRLITGPPGSGKTSYVLDRLREGLRAKNEGIRLLVPTATLAQHLQNRLAREGFVLRSGVIRTLSAFVGGLAADLPELAETTLYLIVEQAARRVNHPDFARVAHMPGFCASLARSIAEFSAAGCNSERLARSLPDTSQGGAAGFACPGQANGLPHQRAPLAAAFLAVCREVDAELKRRGLAMRAERLERAAERIEREGTGGVNTILLDGFHALPEPELRVIAALGRHADLALTLGDGESTAALRARLAAMGFREERATGGRPSPAVVLMRAPNIERECDEIGRRILEQAAAGRPFREMAVIVRAAAAYVPVLQSTLERFGIPARFYFDADLERHAVVRFLAGAVDAMLGGWDHAATLAVLRLAPRLADSDAMDRLDFDAREQLPNSGIGALKGLVGQASGCHSVTRLLDSMAAIEEWRSFVLAPADWAARLRCLRQLYRPPADSPAPDRPGGLSSMREQAAALAAFDEALDEAAAALETGRAIALPEFWRAVKSVLRLKPLRVDDSRANVVHVLSAHEARQWVLPVVFVCGMVEKQFPQFHPQDAFFPDAARRDLNAAGIGVRTAAEFEIEERALFDAAISRATMLATLSYPQYDERGDRNLPSIYLEDLPLVPHDARAVRPRPRHIIELPAPAQAIAAPALLSLIREKTARLSPTALEMFLGCAFRYFGARTLRLEPAPARPEERLDFIEQGNIVHEVLKEWWAQAGDIAPVFERVFERHAGEKRIPPGYRTERLRQAMLGDLRAFAAADAWPRGEFASRTEQSFTFPLDGIEIVGKIDRLDTAADGSAYVIDYKYSGAQRTRDRLEDENLLQAPLYLMAAERMFGLRPAGMFYVGLKRKIVYAGWSATGLMEGEPLPERWLENAAGRTLRIAAEIRAGRIAAAPADAESCRFCDFRDVCRFETGAERVEVLPAGEGA